MQKEVKMSTDSSGILVGLLCILFIGLKLTGYITWSWWWVLSPILVLFGIIGILVIFAIFVFIFILIFSN